MRQMKHTLATLAAVTTLTLALGSQHAFASDDDFGWRHHSKDMSNNSMPHHAPPGMMGGHQNMGKHAGEHGEFSNYREYRPRNAALNFLRMGKMLNLTTEQKTELRKLRDDWIANQSVPQAQLKVARTDLVHMIYSDTDTATIDAHLKQIGQLEGGLWRAFVDHYKAIIKLLNDEQKARVLNDKYFD